jgi:hypothetical protein
MQPLLRRLFLAACCATLVAATPAAAQFGGSYSGSYGYGNSPSYAARLVGTADPRGVDKEGEERPYIALAPHHKQAFEVGIATLRKPVGGQFFEARLDVAIKRLESECGCRLELDHKALADAAIGTDTLVTLDFGVESLRTVLDGLLRPHALTWVPMSPGLLITTQEQADTNPAYRPVVLFPTYDLIVVRDGDRLDYDFDSLIDAITSTVRPETWKEGGTGEGTIAPMSNSASILVTQKWVVQEEIGALLQGMRTLKKQQRLGPLEVVRASSTPIMDDEEPDRYFYRPQTRRRQRTYFGLDR